jgi:hypothetical protein
MSYYPLLRAPAAKGWVTLCNFSPNNWEVKKQRERYINVTWSSSTSWLSKTIGLLEIDNFRTISADEISHIVPSTELTLLSLTDTPLLSESATLPKLNKSHTQVPAWRATLGLSSSLHQTSYQGEMDAFPAEGSLLSFAPLLQFGDDIQNYLILMNLEKSPIKRLSEVEIYDAKELKLRGKFLVTSNAINPVLLDGLNFGPRDLPLIICRGMSGIPLYFSKTFDGSFLSLEHTHPPGSLVIHGQRWVAQKMLKNYWFSKINRCLLS